VLRKPRCGLCPNGAFKLRFFPEDLGPRLDRGLECVPGPDGRWTPRPRIVRKKAKVVILVV